MGGFTGNPPLSTNDPLPAADVPPVNSFSPTTDMNDSLNFLKAHTPDLKDVVKAASGVEDLFAELLLFIVKIVGELWIKLLGILVPLQVDYNNALEALHKAELPIGVPAARDMIADQLAIILGSMGPNQVANYTIPGSDIIAEGEALFTSLIKPFELFSGTTDIRQVGSGIENAEFLLKKAMQLSLAEYTIDSMSNLIGFGWVKALQPMLGFIDRAVNPSNVTRQAMEQGYSFLMKTPIQRDLNHLYPIKDLGVTAISKLYIRGAIDEQTYFNKCLDSGLDNAQAQQLILETAKLLSPGQLGDLLTHGFITEDDMLQQLKQQGYPDWQANALIYWQTHERFFSIQERVGNEAVTAWKKGNIDQTQLESLLPYLGFTADEIALLEIEGTFTLNATDQKSLSESQVKSLFEANLVDLDYVINFFTQEGYAPEDVTRLILLNFVKAEERAAKAALLDARMRVLAQTELAAAAVETNKNETALAAARIALANQLNATLTELGLLQAAPGIMQLIGISLP